MMVFVLFGSGAARAQNATTPGAVTLPYPTPIFEPITMGPVGQSPLPAVAGARYGPTGALPPFTMLPGRASAMAWSIFPAERSACVIMPAPQERFEARVPPFRSVARSPTPNPVVLSL